MATKTLFKKIHTQKIGRAPVVVLPLKLWQKIEAQLEDLEMIRSKTFKAKIAKARLEKKLYSISQVRKIFGV